MSDELKNNQDAQRVMHNKARAAAYASLDNLLSERDAALEDVERLREALKGLQVAIFETYDYSDNSRVLNAMTLAAQAIDGSLK